MNQSVAIIRSLLVYGICLPLAIYLGFVLATPDSWDSLIVVVMVLGVLLVPVLLIWHHPLLVFFWQSVFVVPFISSQPPIWLVLAGGGLVAAVLRRALNRGTKFLSAWPVVWPLLFLTAVFMITAELSGGINLHAGGDAVYGGKRYVYLLGAVMGFFVLISRQIPVEQARNRTFLFFISGASAALSLLVLVLPASMYWIFWLVPPDGFGVLAARGRDSFGPESDLMRLGGFAAAGLAIYYAVLALRGIRSQFTFAGLPWLMLTLAATVMCLLAGFRSVLIMMVVTFAIVFLLEGLVGTRLFAGLTAACVLLTAGLVPFTDRLPQSIQRSLSFLPVKIDPVVEVDARYSSEWRVRMWQAVWPEVGRYLWVGKGYVIDSHELEFAVANPGYMHDSNEVSLLAGDYHNGPLSVLIPFGLPGLAGLLWFFGASTRALHRNYRYGDARLKNINTFLLATFVARVVLFFVVFGSLFSDLFIFTGLIGFGISLNGGIAGPASRAVPEALPGSPAQVPQAAH